MPPVRVRREGAHAVLSSRPHRPRTARSARSSRSRQTDSPDMPQVWRPCHGLPTDLSVGHDILRRVTLQLHRAERTDLLADGLADLLTRPLDDPFARGGRRRPGPGRRALADPAALPPARRAAARGGDGVCAGVRFLQPALAGVPAARPGARRPVGPRPAGLAAARGHRRVASASRGAHAGRPPRPRPRPARTASCVAAAATPSPGGWRACSRRTPCSGPRWSPTGARAATPTARAAPLDDDLRLAARAVAPAGRRGSDAAPPGRAARRRRWTGCAPAADGLDLPARLSLFGHTRLPVTEVELLGALGGAPRRAPVAAAALRARCGTRWPARRPGPVPAGRRHRRPSRSGTRCSPRWAATPASCSAPSRGRRAPARPRLDRAAAAEPTPARLAPGRPARQRASPTPTTGARRVLDPDDRSVAGARLPRRGPPGRRAARGAGRAARGRPDARAARHPGDVPRHRDLRAADPGRASGSPTCPCADAATRRTGCGSGWPTGRWPAPTRCSRVAAGARSSSPAAGSRRPRCSTSRRPSRCRRRFGFTDDDLAQLAPWVDRGRRSAGGSTPTHRADVRAATWPRTPGEPGSTGSCSGSRWRRRAPARSATALPLDDVGSGDIDLAGRLAEYVDRLRRCVRRGRGGDDVGQWIGALASGVARADRACRRDDAWQRAQFDRELAEISDSAGVDRLDHGRHAAAAGRRARAAGAPAGRPAHPGELPHRHADRLHDGADALGAAPGGLPARARRRRVPAQRRRSTATTCSARDPLTGERDARSEDRQLLLDAILAATETLVVTYTGANEHTGAGGRPRCRSASCSTPSTRTDRRRPACASHVLVRPPAAALRRAQPACPARSSGRGRSASTGPRSRGPGRRAAAGAAGRRCSPSRCRRAPEQDVSLADLQAFLAAPGARVPARAGSTSPRRSRPRSRRRDPASSSTALEQWAIGDRMLARGARRASTPTGRAAAASSGAAACPPGPARLAQPCSEIVDQACSGLARGGRAAARATPARSTSTSTSAAGAGCTAPSRAVYGDRLVPVGYSRLAAKHRLRSWSTLLALSAATPTSSWTGHALGKDHGGHRPRAWSRPGSTTGRPHVAARPGRPARPRAARAAAAAAEDRLRYAEARAQSQRGARRARRGRATRVGDRPVPAAASRARTPTPRTCGSTGPARAARGAAGGRRGRTRTGATSRTRLGPWPLRRLGAAARRGEQAEPL